MKYIIFILCVITLFSSCGIDNFEAPNGGIRGQLIDKLTGEGFQAQQPNGFTVKLYEVGWSENEPINIPAKPDGKFRNSFIFQDKYKVIPVEGAFFPVDTQLVNVKMNTVINFEVMPFVAITNINLIEGKGKLTVSYKIEREKVGDKILKSKVLISEIPTVNNQSFDFIKENDLSSIPDDQILQTNFSNEITGLKSDKKYYLRIAVKTDNEFGKYNFSGIIPFKSK